MPTTIELYLYCLDPCHKLAIMLPPSVVDWEVLRCLKLVPVGAVPVLVGQFCGPLGDGRVETHFGREVCQKRSKLVQ